MIGKSQYKIRPLCVALALVWSGMSVDLHAEQYSLLEAIEKAQSQDPWLDGSRFRQENLESLSVNAGTLPDPTVSLGLANLPIDSFDFAQEGMTQFKVGVSQMFPRGKTLALRQETLEKMSQMQPFAREDRKAQVSVTVAQLWLEVYRSQKTIALIQQDRGLFEHLVDVAESSYTTASGRTRQQDLIRAQLELTRLEDRLTMLRQRRESQLAQLGEWLADSSYELDIEMPGRLGEGHLNDPLINETGTVIRTQKLAQILTAHPKIRSIDQKISAGESGVKLAKQSYKPQWGINASYGYRDADPMGNDRADFFSVGVSLDVPLFTGKRQDKQVQAATAESEAIKTERTLVLRQLRSGFETAESQYRRLLDRRELYRSRLLKEMSEQAEASLTAYTHDDGDFAEVVRACIAELNARIEALNVEVDIHKIVAQLNYFLIPSHKKNSAVLTDASRASGELIDHE